MYLEFRLPFMQAQSNNSRWIQSLTHYLVETVDIEIGGQLIDRHYGDWLEIWSQLTLPSGQSRGYDDITGNTKNGGVLGQPCNNPNHLNNGNLFDVDGNGLLYIPLQFWFCRNVGLSLPLIALQYHEVKLYLKIRQLSDLMIADGDLPTASTGSFNVTLWTEYIYLDVDERRRFAQVSHEYLIEQLQLNEFQFTSNTIDAELTFNHPVKELVWVCRHSTMTDNKQWANYTTLQALVTDLDHRKPKLDSIVNLLNPPNLVVNHSNDVAQNITARGTLHLNGHQRFEPQTGAYFNIIQTLDHHTRAPLSTGINVYSFALKPEAHQPNGTCNFSRIDNAQLKLILNTRFSNGTGPINTVAGVLKVFATNYNVLRIMSGMGGLAYSG